MCERNVTPRCSESVFSPCTCTIHLYLRLPKQRRILVHPVSVVRFLKSETVLHQRSRNSVLSRPGGAPLDNAAGASHRLCWRTTPAAAERRGGAQFRCGCTAGVAPSQGFEWPNPLVPVALLPCGEEYEATAGMGRSGASGAGSYRNKPEALQAIECAGSFARFPRSRRRQPYRRMQGPRTDVPCTMEFLGTIASFQNSGIIINALFKLIIHPIQFKSYFNSKCTAQQHGMARLSESVASFAPVRVQMGAFSAGWRPSSLQQATCGPSRF